MKSLALKIAATSVLIAASVAGSTPVSAATEAVGPGSPYALGRQACRLRGKRLKLIGEQTDDRRLATEGVKISYICVPMVRPAAPARARARASAQGAPAHRR